jgi:Fe2+ or Zn2+ uptake regulation protein
MQTRAAQQPVADLLIRRDLEAAGVRHTRQRLDLARAIFGSGDRHFTAETLYHETRAIYFAPTLGTIYNTLSEFARADFCEKSRFTTRRSGTTQRPDHISTSILRTPTSCPTSLTTRTLDPNYD